MANQLSDDKRRTVFISDLIDYDDLEGYAHKMGFTVSVLLREAVYRLAEEIRQNKKIVLLRQPHDNEGHATGKPHSKTPRPPKKKG
jgi:hypothetical protein